MPGRNVILVFCRVATQSEKSRDAPPPSALLPPSWRGAIRIFRRILTSHSQGPMVQIPSWSVPVSVFLFVVLCLITSALCRRSPVLSKVFPRTFQSLSPLALRRFIPPRSALSSSSPSFCLQRKCISHFGRLRNFTADVAQASSSIFVGHSASFTAAGARTMKKGYPQDCSSTELD